MATIKSFTSLEQSRKLAEILPLESADMWYSIVDNESFVCFERHYEYEQIPCWSLAALLGVLPKRIEIVDNVYELSVYLYGLYYWNIRNGNLCFESKDKDNLVDACYEMILKLNKLKCCDYGLRKEKQRCYKSNQAST